ncbi:MAG: hypothetical protein WBZ33_02870 [Thermoactinomyces sp.]
MHLGVKAAGDGHQASVAVNMARGNSDASKTYDLYWSTNGSARSLVLKRS